jgi:hypothetical protein
MSLSSHMHVQAARRRKRKADRFARRLRSTVRIKPIFSVCVAIVAVHGVAVALLLPGTADAFLRVAMLLCAVLGAPVLVLWYARQGRVARVLSAGLVGLGAIEAGVVTSVPHAVLVGPGGSDYTGILATLAGFVLVWLAFRDALRGRRLAVKLLLGIPACAVIVQWLIVPAANVGVITNAPRPAAVSAGTLGLRGARDVSFPMRGMELVSGETEPPGLNQTVGRIHVPVLLIASNATGEHAIDQIYRDRIGHNATLWYLPHAGHTDGLRAYPVQYKAHVSAFLALALR